MKLTTIVGHVGGSCKGNSDEQQAWDADPVSSDRIRAVARSSFNRILSELDKKSDGREFEDIERSLRSLLFSLGRVLLAYYLQRRHEEAGPIVERWRRRGFCREALRRRYLGTIFGRVIYWRTHLRGAGRRGIFPLDLALGLTRDRISFFVAETAARLSTLMSYEQVTAICLYFMSWSPSKTSVERAVLGFGAHTQDWFQAAPPPEGDGEVLVIQIDSKATPTVTEDELKKRRGKRDKRKKAPSPRHRGRQKRKKRGPKKRRKKGDKTKNGKAVTIVVMYTLERSRDKNGKPILLGPINKRYYASYAPKRHAFAVARREATKRGFGPKTRKQIHIITDGDEDLERYAKEFLPDARHTLDVIHVLEYFWEAGRLQFAEGSDDLTRWVKARERQLYNGKCVLALLALNELKVYGRKEERLESIKNYLQKRLEMMNYDELRAEDLDVSSGIVEGAVRHVIAKRFDSGGMRWIRERAEALLQLRCIELNGDWAAFARFTRGRLLDVRQDEEAPRLLRKTAEPLPSLGVAA